MPLARKCGLLAASLLMGSLASSGVSRAQETIFPAFPQWTSQPAPTVDVQLVDVDTDGHLDLVQVEPSLITFYSWRDGAYPPTGKTLDPAEQPTRPVFGDLDGDGDLDLVAVGRGVVLIYGNLGGAFRFSERTDFPADFVGLADADNDGDLDLFRVDAVGYALHLNQGGIVQVGSFEPTPVWMHASTGATLIAFADVNGDGRVDFASGSPASPTVDVFINTGASFTATSLNTGLGPTSDLAFGDVDGDRDFDLVTNRFLYRNVGGALDPNFETISNDASCVGLGDLDADGDLDLVLGRATGGALVRLGDAGGFQPTPAWTGPSDSTTQTALGDVNGDGALDLVTGNSRIPSAVFLNSTPWLAPAPSWEGAKETGIWLALADLDGDQDLDLVRGNAASVSTYLNDRTSLNPSSTLAAPDPRGHSLGDVDNDGDLDLGLAFGSYQAAIYPNLGGGFDPNPIWTGGSATPADLSFVDLDRDGDLDLVAAGTAVWAFRNQRSALDDVPFWESTVEALKVETGNFDRSGYPGIVAGRWSLPGGSVWYRNDAGEPDTLANPINPGVSVSQLCVADVDGDSRDDLIEVNDFGPTLYLAYDGGISTTPTFLTPGRYNTKECALEDLDGDGDPDLVASGQYPQFGGTDAYRNDGGKFSLYPSWTNPGASLGQVALGDVDGDGDVDAMVTEVDAPTDGEPAFARLYPNRSGWTEDPDAAAVPGGLPDNAAHLRWVRTDSVGINRIRISALAVDAESDPVWIAGEYSFQGTGIWARMEFPPGRGSVGPLATSPEGVLHEFEWDIERVPFDIRNALIRLAVISPPRRGAPIQYQPSYLKQVGRVSPSRPALGILPPSLDFGAVTLGDIATAIVQITNVGTSDLLLDRMQSADADLLLPDVAGVRLRSGEKLQVKVQYAPRTVGVPGYIHIQSNDPVQPDALISTAAEVLRLSFETRLISTMPEVPLGEAVTIIVTPDPGVAIERGYVSYRSRGETDFLARADLVPQGVNLATVIPGNEVRESGLEYYVEVANGDVIAADPPKAPEEFFYQPVAAPTEFSARAEAAPGGDYTADQPIRIVAVLPAGSQFVDGKVFFRPGGSTGADSVALEVPEISIGSRDPFAVIPGTAVGPRGVEFWARVRTATRVMYDPPNTPGVQPHEVRVVVRNLSEVESALGGRYRMVSVPLDTSLPLSGTLEALLADQPEFGPYDPTRWRSLRYHPDLARYVEIADPAESSDFLRPEPGRGFWLICTAPNRIQTGPVVGRSTSTAGPYSIPLEPGWNQIGNPWPFVVAWSDALHSTAIGEPVRFDPALGTAGEYVSTPVTLLQPFEGYFVENTSPDPETMFLLPIERAVPVPLSATAAAELSGWSARLLARTEAAEDGGNRFGVNDAAREQLDPLDRREPPVPPGPWVQLAFANQEWREGPGRYREDFRGPAEGHAWELEVRSPAAAEAVTIAVPEAAGWPETLCARLLDRELQVTAELSPGRGGFRLLSLGPERPYRLTLLAGTKEYVERATREQQETPRTIALEPAAPNPMRDASRLAFALPAEADVSLEIFDVAGQRVAAPIENERLPAGRHARVWDGAGRNGAALPSGIYFYRLRVGEAVFTRRLVLVR